MRPRLMTCLIGVRPAVDLSWKALIQGISSVTVFAKSCCIYIPAVKCIKMQYVHLHSIADTSIKCTISLQSTPMVKSCIFTCHIFPPKNWNLAKSEETYPRYMYLDGFGKFSVIFVDFFLNLVQKFLSQKNQVLVIFQKCSLQPNI